MKGLVKISVIIYAFRVIWVQLHKIPAFGISLLGVLADLDILTLDERISVAQQNLISLFSAVANEHPSFRLRVKFFFAFQVRLVDKSQGAKIFQVSHIKMFVADDFNSSKTSFAIFCP